MLFLVSHQIFFLKNKQTNKQSKTLYTMGQSSRGKIIACWPHFYGWISNHQPLAKKKNARKMHEFQSLLGKANWTCLGIQCSIPNPGSQNIHALLSYPGRFRFILWSSRIAAGPGFKCFLLVLLQWGHGRWVAPVVEWGGWGLPILVSLYPTTSRHLVWPQIF